MVPDWSLSWSLEWQCVSREVGDKCLYYLYQFETLAGIEKPAENSNFAWNMPVCYISANNITVAERKRRNDASCNREKYLYEELIWAAQMYCSSYQMYCSCYQMYCSSYQMYCSSYQMYCSSYQMYCSSYQMYCSSYQSTAAATSDRFNSCRYRTYF